MINLKDREKVISQQARDDAKELSPEAQEELVAAWELACRQRQVAKGLVGLITHGKFDRTKAPLIECEGNSNAITARVSLTGDQILPEAFGFAEMWGNEGVESGCLAISTFNGEVNGWNLSATPLMRHGTDQPRSIDVTFKNFRNRRQGETIFRVSTYNGVYGVTMDPSNNPVCFDVDPAGNLIDKYDHAVRLHCRMDQVDVSFKKVVNMLRSCRVGLH